jgi:hypothetical protein
MDLSSWQQWSSNNGNPQDQNSFEADPSTLFVDYPNLNFYLKPTSPAIDAGTNVPVYNDYDGNVRPQGVGYDIGAYEYLSGVSCVDNDGDGYGVGCALGNDCDDNNVNVNPGMSEVCGDGIDNNCVNGIDEGCGVECSVDLDCDDFVDCSVDSCSGGSCVYDSSGCDCSGADINNPNDGKVDIADLAAIVIGDCVGANGCDVSGDGQVDILDLVYVAVRMQVC